MVEVVRIGAVDFRVKENPELPLRNNWIGCISTSVSEIELAPALVDAAETVEELEEIAW